MSEQAVYIVDDDAAVRDSLALMLGLKGIRAASFASSEDFLASARRNWTGCVLADLRMPGMSGLELQQRLLRDHPGLAVVIITAHGDVGATRQAFLSQAVDFIEKPFTAEQILSALAAAANRRPVDTGQRPTLEEWACQRLTQREAEVLSHVVQGRHNRDIAAQLGISPRTVEVHKARLLEKLGARNLVELVRIVDSSTAQPR